MLTSVIVATTAGLSLFFTWTASRGGARNGLLVVSLVFVLFAFGPAVNFALGSPIYAGIDVRNAAAALTGFTLACAAIALADRVLPLRLVPAVTWPAYRYPVYGAALLAAAGWGSFVVATRLTGTIGQNKLVQVAAAGAAHYPYLLLQILLACGYFYCWSSTDRALWRINFAVYVAYALLTSERDFLFVAAAIFVHREYLLDKRRSARALGLGVAAVVVASALASVRVAVQGTNVLTSVLNQGSILFVDTQLHRLVPERIEYFHGRSFVDAVLRPLGLTDTPALPEWFVSIYSPGNPSGYGFSLTGEAYLNFGILAVPVLFFVLAAAHRLLLRRAVKSQGAMYLSTVFLATWLYALRGDMSQLVSTMVYASVIAAILLVTRMSTSWSAAHRSPAAPALTTAER